MTYQVVQWATGSIGRVCLRHVIDRSDLALVGLLTYSPEKVGRDAGAIAKRDPVGVTAVDDRQSILALDADVVLHTPLNGVATDEHDDDILALLSSGKNVITTVGFTNPFVYEADRVARLEEACQRGGVTLFGTGINPGTVAERIGVTLTSICTDVEHLFVREVYDCSPVASPGFIFDLAGFGMKPDDFDNARAGREPFFESLFGEVVGFVGASMGVEFEAVEPDHDVSLAREDLTLPAGTVERGTVANIRWRWHGIHEGARLFTIQMDWVLDRSEPGWEAGDGWRIEIEGAPRVAMDLVVDDPVGRTERSKAIQYAVAGPVVRAIPDVVAASPGILLPPVFAAYRPPNTS